MLCTPLYHVSLPHALATMYSSGTINLNYRPKSSNVLFCHILGGYAAPPPSSDPRPLSLSGTLMGFYPCSENETLTLCWFDAGPALQTLACIKSTQGQRLVCAMMVCTLDTSHSPHCKKWNIYNGREDNIGIQINRKDLTKTFKMIFN